MLAASGLMTNALPAASSWNRYSLAFKATDSGKNLVEAINPVITSHRSLTYRVHCLFFGKRLIKSPMPLILAVNLALAGSSTKACQNSDAHARTAGE